MNDAPDVVNDFEAWARVSAELHGRDEAEGDLLLQRQGLAGVLENGHASWSKALAGDMVELSLRRVLRYAEILAEELEGRDLQGGAEADFRHQALYGRVRTPTPSPIKKVGGTPFTTDAADRAPTTRMRLGAGFLESLPTSRVEAPAPDQDTTRHGDAHNPFVDALAAAEAAIAWPVEHWARYRAELLAGQEDDAVVHARHGLVDPKARAHVERKWQARLAADTVLEQRFVSLCEPYVEAIPPARS